MNRMGQVAFVNWVVEPTSTLPTGPTHDSNELMNYVSLTLKATWRTLFEIAFNPEVYRAFVFPSRSPRRSKSRPVEMLADIHFFPMGKELRLFGGRIAGTSIVVILQTNLAHYNPISSAPRICLKAQLPIVIPLTFLKSRIKASSKIAVFFLRLLML